MARRLAVCAVAVACVGIACGLEVVGTHESADEGGDATIAPSGDASPDAVAEAGNEAGNDAAIDAGPSCGFLQVIDPLTMLLGDGGGGGWFVTHDGSNGVYPKIDPSDAGPAVSLITPGVTSSLGAIWRGPMPLHAFDVSFRYIITCTTSPNCSDGIVAVWLESRDGGPAELNSGTSANTFAIPARARGSAVLLDIHTDSVTNDPATPAVSLLAIDPAKAPGSYDWHVASSPPDAGYLGAHQVHIQLAKKNGLVVQVDGETVLTAPAPSMDFVGWFGLGASVASDPTTFVVYDFDAAFYLCDDP